MGIEERLASVKRELSYLRGVVEQMDKRVNDLVHRIDRLKDRMGKLEDRMSSQFKWTIGILVGMWSSTIALLIAILLKLIGFF